MTAHAKGTRISLYRERAATLVVLKRFADAKLDIDMCLTKTELSFGRGNVAYARCLWLAAKIEHYLNKPDDASAMLQEALTLFRSSKPSLGLDFAQALMFEAEITPSMASSAKSEAKKLLTPLNEYWLANQWLAQLD